MKARYGTDILICSKCGSPNKFDAKFCMKCSYAIIEEIRLEGRNCPTCGVYVKEGAKFCIRCGTKIE